MASAMEQQSVRRKFFYFGLILFLFTCSLLHRKLVVNAQADELMLRDIGRGKADLTDSALRLTLSGVRGVAVTSLWLTAIEKQRRNEWNELELAVDSLTRLQPHFTSPWFFQGWNLAFNVAVECDRPRDKYYYVTRGIALLCRGDEKNDPGLAVPPKPWPASPDMRFQIANTYHRKIGQSDENKTMRCLFDLSCMTPADREQFSAGGSPGKLDLTQFMTFCENHPRFVRRLREGIKRGFDSPRAIVQFINDNKDIPSRLEIRNKLEDDQRLAEFPILPPHQEEARAICPYPDWRSETLATSTEDFDIFVCMRAWHTYAQVPLPPPGAVVGRRNVDRTKYRLPRITTIVFRSYPARSQAFFAEELQKDGWFDGGGWPITGWFKTVAGNRPVVAGADSRSGTRFHSGLAWNKAHDLYYQLGTQNGFPLELAALIKLENDARLSPLAFDQLQKSKSDRQITNFDEYFQQTKVERTAEAVAARKAIFEVKYTEESASFKVVDIYRDKVLPQWLDLLLRNPEFRQIASVQEETYELQAKFFYVLQRLYKAEFANLVKTAAYSVPLWAPWPVSDSLPAGATPQGSLTALWPHLLKQEVDQRGLEVMYIRDVEGLLDRIYLLEGRDAEANRSLESVKRAAAVLARQALWPPPPEDRQLPDFAFARFVVWPPATGTDRARPEIGLGLEASWPLALKAYLSSENATALAGIATGASWPAPTFLMLSSAEERRILTRLASHRQPPSGQGWTPLIPTTAIQQARIAIRWLQPRPEPTSK